MKNKKILRQETNRGYRVTRENTCVRPRVQHPPLDRVARRGVGHFIYAPLEQVRTQTGGIRLFHEEADFNARSASAFYQSDARYRRAI